MKLLRCLSIILLMTIFNDVNAQQKLFKIPPFISLNIGFHHTAKKNFEDIYQSKTGIIYGGSFGLPVSNRTYLYGETMFFHKNGTAVYSMNDSQMKSSGDANFQQWLINAGIKLNILNIKSNILNINSGITYTIIDEDIIFSDKLNSSKISGKGLLGLNVGAGLDHFLENKPISIFINIQDVLSRGDISSLVGDYGGFYTNTGVKYHFNSRTSK